LSSFSGKSNNLYDSLIAFLGRKNKHQTTYKSKRAQKKENKSRSNANKEANFKKTKKNDNYVRPVYEYKNMFDTRLKAEINKAVVSELRKDDSIHNLNKSKKRIISLSTYLKEYMVGFVTPDGDHWFQESLPYLYKGCVAKDIDDSKFEAVAKEFWGLLSKADNYWKSEDFLGYLNAMKKTPAVKATIAAIEDLQDSDLCHYREVAFTGYPSKIKYIPELNYCAYSGRELKWDSNEWHNPSAEHILPHSVGGDDANLDINYLVTSAHSNSLRDSIPLLAFLKGWDAKEYIEKHSK
ncbi:MAG: hypothetical protein AB1782_10650, partial [Cyanobacteriota bacterium]